MLGAGRVRSRLGIVAVVAALVPPPVGAPGVAAPVSAAAVAVAATGALPSRPAGEEPAPRWRPAPAGTAAPRPAVRRPVRVASRPNPAAAARRRTARTPFAPRPRVAVARPARTETLAQRGARLLDSLRYDWRRVGFRIEFRPYTHSYLGMTYPEQKVIHIYVKPSQSDWDVLHVLGHELGHAVDVTYLDDAQRADYLHERGIDPRTEWFPCGRCSDFRTPAGDFAEVFEYWLLGAGDFESRMAGPPTREQMASLRSLFVAPAVTPSPSPTPSP